MLPSVLFALALAATEAANAPIERSAQDRDVLLYLGEFDPELDPIDLSEMPPLEQPERDQTIERKRPNAPSKKNH
jgi:hypothetical protein